MTNRQQPHGPVTSSTTATPEPPLAVDVRWTRIGVSVDVFVNAAFRWLCRGNQSPSLRVVAVGC